MKTIVSSSRRWRAGWRDTSLLLRDFRLPLVSYGLAIVGGGLLYHYLAALAGEPLDSPVAAIYTVLTMTFLQAASGFPRTWYLQIFYFVMPIVGLGILAQGLAEFGTALFNRRSRTKEWEMAVASTFSNHIILVGLGHLGFRVVRYLHAMDQDLVVIERDPEKELVASVRAMNIPVLQGDATRDTLLQAAGVAQARVIVLCTQNDNLNLQIAVKARSMNPNIQVVMRIFDDDFATALQKQFGFSALSATGMAAPVFAATACGIDITQPITIEGQAFSLARLNISPRSKLAGLTVKQIEGNYSVSVVLWRHDGNIHLHPIGDERLATNDALAVLGGSPQIHRLVQDNK